MHELCFAVYLRGFEVKLGYMYVNIGYESIHFFFDVVLFEKYLKRSQIKLYSNNSIII
jgi:hypothetical protein